jgi:hypothetical protein
LPSGNSTHGIINNVLHSGQVRTFSFCHVVMRFGRFSRTKRKYMLLKYNHVRIYQLRNAWMRYKRRWKGVDGYSAKLSRDSCPRKSHRMKCSYVSYCRYDCGHHRLTSGALLVDGGWPNGCARIHVRDSPANVP